MPGLVAMNNGRLTLPTASPVGPTDSENWVVLQSAADALVALAGGGNPGTPIETRLARFATVTTIGDSASLPASVAGLSITVRNDGANTLAVFPAAAEAINGLADASFALPAGTETTFECFGQGQWVCALSN